MAVDVRAAPGTIVQAQETSLSVAKTHTEMWTSLREHHLRPGDQADRDQDRVAIDRMGDQDGGVDDLHKDQVDGLAQETGSSCDSKWNCHRMTCVTRDTITTTGSQQPDASLSVNPQHSCHFETFLHPKK